MSAAAEPPRVLHVNPDVRGGMRTVMLELFASSLGRDFRLEAISTFDGAGARRRLLAFGRSLAQLTAWSLRGRGRIVHVHATVRGSMYRKGLCVLAARALRRRVVLQVHSGPGDLEVFRAGLGPVRAALLGFAIRRADVVVAVSARSAERLAEGFAPAGIVIVANPAPAPAERLAAASRRQPPLAVFLGGFENPVKGGAEILAATALLAPGAVELALAGPGEPPRSAALDGERARWLGWLEPPELERLLDDAAIFVLSSTSEGLPMVLLEAMARGMGIVATDVGGVPEVLADGEQGLLVEPGDVGSLAAALARLAADRELRERLGGAARRRAAGMGVEAVAARFEAIYGDLLAR